MNIPGSNMSDHLYLLNKLNIYIMEHLCVSVSEFDNLYKKEETYNASHSINEHIAALCYDHIWIAALALNCTENKLKDMGK